MMAADAVAKLGERQVVLHSPARNRLSAMPYETRLYYLWLPVAARCRNLALLGEVEVKKEGSASLRLPHLGQHCKAWEPAHAVG